MKKRLTSEEFVQLARSVPRDERSPYAFEKRVMAHLGDARSADPLALWAQALWRAVTPCLGIMILAAAVSFTSAPEETATDADAIDLEGAVLEPTESAFDLSV